MIRDNVIKMNFVSNLMLSKIQSEVAKNVIFSKYHYWVLFLIDIISLKDILHAQ